ncbi:hypothetical protein D9758_001428 [Tetrapyrgos nigripes]|uniref:Uncharacterized protein n=1 Tax=Tetrapyrgos nigripes TaxID=182062 RepID=A0A8H5GSG0_9AGAR|nr:hypothetical protein D9758_001428 [Tetrapyrgos nigripes]
MTTVILMLLFYQTDSYIIALQSVSIYLLASHLTRLRRVTSRLNEEVKDEGLSVVDTIIRATPKRSFVLAFNYASSTTTSSFHSSPPLPQTPPPTNTSFPPTSSPKSAYNTAPSPDSSLPFPQLPWACLPMATSDSDAFGEESDIYGAFEGSGMLQYDRGDPLMKGDPYMREWTEELAEMITGEKIERYEEYEGESEGNASPTPAPTPKSPPPGVSPSSPASGVSASNNPLNHPLHPRFIHTSTPFLADKNNKNLGEENMIPTSLFDEPTPQNASSFNMGLGLNNAALTLRYQRTLSRSDHYTMAMSKPSAVPLMP